MYDSEELGLKYDSGDSDLDPNDGWDLGSQDLADTTNVFQQYFITTPEKIEVLDVGSGTGRIVVKLHETLTTNNKESKLDLVDINKVYIGKIKKNKKTKKCVRKAYVGDALKSSSYKQHYDVIMVCGVAQYFDDTHFVSLLSLIKKQLKPNGKIFLREQSSCEPLGNC